MNRRIDVIATTISGSISDWGKVERIVPLFREHGEDNVTLRALDTHRDARARACELTRAGADIVISAGGSGTFNAVVEGCHDAGVDLDPLRLGFLRKGSADLIGKVLKMPDDIEEAIKVFVESIREDRFIPCDVIQASSELGEVKPRRFVGYGGAEIFGEIPYITESRFMKYYKGILSQFFGDLGPFAVGTSLTILKRLILPRKRAWEIVVDGEAVCQGRFQALILVNGDLGPNMPLAKNVPLGSGDFHLFAIRNLGFSRLPGQLRAAWNASVLDKPVEYGLETFRITRSLVLRTDGAKPFPLNVDGSILPCRGSARCELTGRLNLISR